MSKSLVLVDIQNDYFPDGAMELNDMDAAAAEMLGPLVHKRAALRINEALREV